MKHLWLTLGVLSCFTLAYAQPVITPSPVVPDRDRSFKEEGFHGTEVKPMERKDFREFKDKDFHGTDFDKRDRAKFVDKRDVDFHVKHKNIFSWKDKGDTVVVKYREILRDDPILVTYADTIDFVQCGDTLILFGVVSDEAAKADIQAKFEEVGDGAVIENRIIVR